jgi:DNA primase
MCHCWVCSLKGKSPYKIIKDHCHPSLAAKYAKLFNLKKKNEEKEEEILHIPTGFKLLVTELKSRDPDTRDCIRYLKKRGVTEELMWYHKIGRFRGYKWSRRVVFPSFNTEQNIDFYVSRTIDNDAFFKYQNAKADKTKIIFDEIRLDWQKELVIVEGVFDMVKSTPNTVCLLGSNLRENSKLFTKIIENKTPVILALDNDMRKKTLDIAKRLNGFGITVKILNMIKYDDLGDAPRDFVRQKLKDAPIYSREQNLRYLIQNISSGSIF